MGFQASILLSQHYLGSRWFIPRQLKIQIDCFCVNSLWYDDGWQILPEKYSYYRRFNQDTNHATDCVICMSSVDLRRRLNDCMVTPCGHFFHSGCLQRWMDVKMECPTCRRSLPPA
ncbi:hypothetical protein HHK36_005298 [Tetracentron sinense]|uniref:RING-type E3 ubiquitin transferase n=1 Tax=Tetracentron sinense TaxID=13715 RepID=A0A834ZKV2_TETSI|nr:hypothetical protein HHK36_005298 [Tetracentron sinense]